MIAAPAPDGTDSHSLGRSAFLQIHRDGQKQSAADPRGEVIDEAAAARHQRVSDARQSNSPLDFWKFLPDLHAAEVRAFGADGRGDSGADVARRPEVSSERRKRGADLLDLFHRGLVNLLLRVEAGAHRPLVQQMQQRAGFDQANGFRVRQQVERDFAAARRGRAIRFSPPRRRPWRVRRLRGRARFPRSASG